MILQAVIGNANHLDYGVVTIPFPIPMKEEDYVLELLESLEIGRVLERIVMWSKFFVRTTLF